MPSTAPEDNRPLWQWSATRIATATRAGTVSCRDVTAAVVERMRAVNPHLNAITLDLGDSALADAEALDRQRAAGVTPGPLFGVPITIKDNVDVKDQRTPNGVPGLAGIIAPEDSPVVGNLRRAGAVIVGRTNTPEFSMRATTNNPLYGLTRNPWDERISCGGSSGGAGAAVAAGIGAIGHGNDIGGSIRFPALQCGVAGLKPSLGRIPAYLPSSATERPLVSSMMSVQGPLARSIADLRLALTAMAAGDPRDPLWVPAPLEGPPVARRVGLVERIDGVETAPQVTQALRTAAQALQGAGYTVELVTPPDLNRTGEMALRLISTDMNHQILQVARRLGSKQINTYFDAWFKCMPPFATLGEYLDGLASRATWLRRWQMLLDQYPLILVPQRMERLLEVDEDFRGDEHLAHILRGFGPSITFNFLGLPTVQVPTGLHNGEPCGVQLVAGRYREDLCLEAAQVVESACGQLVTKLWDR